MIPVSYTNQQFASIIADRTKSILSHYQGEYEVTLLVVSLLGIIVIPRERYYVNINNKSLSKALLSRLQKCVVINEINDMPSDDYSLSVILTGIRNAVCHGAIDYEGDDEQGGQKKISSISFENFFENNDKGETRHFKIILSVEDIKEMLEGLCDYYSRLSKTKD